MTRRYSKEAAAILPWAAAALLWFGLITPLRAREGGKLVEQSQMRRDRLKADRHHRETQALLTRVKAALAPSCRGSVDPAALRQRTIAATDGLRLSPFSLSVTGPPNPGALVEAEGTRASVLELVSRLGDPKAGRFLRTVSVRDLGSRFSTSAVLAPFLTLPGGGVASPPECEVAPERTHRETAPSTGPTPSAARSGPARAAVAAPTAVPTPALPEPPAPAPPPFALVAFLRTAGEPRVSVRSGDQVFVVSVGEQVLGWKCVAIDRDLGAVFEGAGGRRVELKASPRR